MKSTKTLFLTALAVGSLLAFGTVANAGDTTNNPPPAPPAGGPPPGGPGMRGQAGFDRMAEQLNLTAEQKPKVQSILDTQRQKIRELRQDPNFNSLSQEDRRAKMKAIQDTTVAQMKAVLTADQFQKWQDMQSQMRQRRPSGPPPSGNPPPAAPPQN
jgi:Spy/CpxP family protein refolding chaperone